MIPDFLEPFKDQLEKYRLETIQILATPTGKNEVLSLKQSKFLGKPYLPIDTRYPKCPDGTPMIMLAQINFAELPKLNNYPQEGILQLYVNPTDWYDTQNYQILFHADTRKECLADFDFLKAELYEESPVYCEHTLSFKKEIEYGCAADSCFCMNFNEKNYFDFLETLPTNQQEQMDKFFYTIGHKIGGYAYFTQSDPRSNDEDVLLLQIDTDKQIMFGDAGVAHVFINSSDLEDKNFDKAYFYWDCC